MAYSYNSYSSTGAATYSFTFDYIASTVTTGADPKGIEVHVDGVMQTSVGSYPYSVDTSANTITFTGTAPAAQKVITILPVSYTHLTLPTILRV